MPAIEVSHVTKEYQLGALESLKQKLVHTGARLMGRAVEPTPLFKALDDVNFSIEPGEVVGIIGHNGAGKSTLLKMLANISTPTSGHVKVNGRVAPLIEVGAGFVGDFTGRENVYLNGAILGMSKREIDRKFDEIIDFAEMAEFIDTPVKRYSSGMQVKLAFAVATSIEAEILIVDEVLAVGDLAFQRKCFDRMEDLIKRQKRTVLLVSHNIRQVERLCSRVLLLHKGQLVQDGDGPAVCNAFTSIMNDSIQRDRSAQARRELQDSGEIRRPTIKFLDADKAETSTLRFDQKATLKVEIDVLSSLRGVAVYIGIHTSDFVYITNNNTFNSISNFSIGRHVIELEFESVKLIPGLYSVLLWIGTPEGKVSYHAEAIASFSVSSDDFSITRQMGQALFHMPAGWRIDYAPLATQMQMQAPATDLNPVEQVTK